MIGWPADPGQYIDDHDPVDDPWRVVIVGGLEGDAVATSHTCPGLPYKHPPGLASSLFPEVKFGTLRKSLGPQYHPVSLVRIPGRDSEANETPFTNPAMRRRSQLRFPIIPGIGRIIILIGDIGGTGFTPPHLVERIDVTEIPATISIQTVFPGTTKKLIVSSAPPDIVISSASPQGVLASPTP